MVISRYLVIMTLNGYKLRDQVSIPKLNIASPNGIHKCPKIGVWPNAINVVKHAMKRNERFSACNVSTQWVSSLF